MWDREKISLSFRFDIPGPKKTSGTSTNPSTCVVLFFRMPKQKLSQRATGKELCPSWGLKSSDVKMTPETEETEKKEGRGKSDCMNLRCAVGHAKIDILD